MEVEKAYNNWAEQYDTNQNKTRDLEAIALKKTLVNFQCNNCLEIGCGTGKNTNWLATKTKHITAIDLSNEMLAKAKEKIKADNVDFIQADITKEWNFANKSFDLVTYSLVLEHIPDLDDIFRKTASIIIPNGYVYIGELHPFKQYTGTKARFDSEEGQQIVNCFNHNISDFIQSALKNNFEIIDINEHFDDHDRTTIPRILTILLKKNNYGK